ncbi:zinc transporter ZupT [Candidatus Bipolaricaulota bacterium]
MSSAVGFGLLLSTLAGLSTLIGGAFGLISKRPGPRFMALTLGFSAGVMIYISFVALLQSGIESVGSGPAHLAFFLGMGAMFLVDALIPHDYFDTHDHGSAQGGDHEQRSALMKTGLFVALGIGIHNFPEGMASFVGALQDPSLGISIALAIAIHNIPEGLAVAAPIYAASGSRRKALLWTFLSGIAEPLGACVAALILLPFLSDAVLGYVVASVAGIMVFISLDELIPVSRSYGKEHLSILGVAIGMGIMFLSLWALG